MSSPKMNLTHPCAHFTRRQVIQAGAIGLMGLGMNHLSAIRALAAPAARPATASAKSVIYIFLSGGLAQHESFDMKPDAPLEIRGEFKPISTATPGIQICEHLPLLAQRSEKWALVRSLTHAHNEHSNGHHIMLTGRSEMPPGFDPNKPKSTDWPSIASQVSSLLPPHNNLPPALVLPDKIVHNSGRTIPGQFGGMMGAKADPWFLEMSPYHSKSYGAYPKYLFHFETGSVVDPGLRFQAPHLSLPQGLSLDRVMNRIGLRGQIERQAAAYDKLAGDEQFDRYREAAISLLANSEVHDAFSLEKADPKLLDRYGRNSFGWSLLMARRLIATGVRLVQVNLGNNESWDTHQNAWPTLREYLLPPMDQAVSALLDDLESTGELGQTLIVMGSEFGRTPQIKSLKKGTGAGRDHWGACQSLLLAGGGVKGGRVIGESDKIGAFPKSSPQTPENLAATIYDALGLSKDLTWPDFSGRPHHLYNGDPIKGLM